MSRKQFAIVLLTVGVCSLLGGAIMSRVLAPRAASAIIDIPTKIPDVIRAHKFVVVDDKDKACAIIGDIGLRIVGPDNKTRVIVGKNGISIFSADNDAGAMIGDIGLRVLSPNNKTCVVVGQNGIRIVNPDSDAGAMIGDSGLEVYDADGKVRFKTP